MVLTPDQVELAADLLDMADSRRAPIGPLTQHFPEMDVADAYAIQQRNLGRGCAGAAPWSATRSG